MKYIVCNLKNKMDKNSNIDYSDQLELIDTGEYKLVIAPSMPFLDMYDHMNYSLASQDISSFQDKTITGEVTGEQLKSLGCEYVIIGHSERRLYNNEININFINKINNAQEVGLTVIYCIGESLDDRVNNETYNVLEKQISEVLNNVLIKNIIIAYEPTYAIGGNYILSKEEIQDAIEYIKDITFEKYETVFKVLYGGGVNKEVVTNTKKIDNLDGYLVGTAGNDINELNQIFETLKSSK